MILIGIDKKKPRYKRVEITLEGSVLLKQLVDAVEDIKYSPCNVSCLSKEEAVNFLAYAQKILDVHKGEPFKQKVINGKIGLYEFTYGEKNPESSDNIVICSSTSVHTK
ncbi:hypothetical protein [Alteribacillus sp. HJP-4]|uniref:hypothetical protein n=1 Tax=Alteribacillus sp. HJP-4 TaxID=2775394 RepID=UPI0035CCF769